MAAGAGAAAGGRGGRGISPKKRKSGDGDGGDKKPAKKAKAKKDGGVCRATMPVPGSDDDAFAPGGGGGGAPLPRRPPLRLLRRAAGPSHPPHPLPWLSPPARARCPGRLDGRGPEQRRDLVAERRVHGHDRRSCATRLNPSA